MAWYLNGNPPSIILPGVYKIYNIITGDFYIGSTKNLKKRFYSHRNSLRRGMHQNKHLQYSYNKYGAENFYYEILLWCDIKDILLWEQKIIDIQKPTFNKLFIAGSPLGFKMSEETKQKMSLAHKGKNFTTEFQREVSSRIHKGKIISQYQKEKLLKTHLRIERLPETKEKIRKAMLGKVRYLKTHYISLISPEGIVYSNITNGAKFGREHGFIWKHMWAVIKGKVSQHKGWRLYKE
jgi:group I intron endonuclease